MVRLSLGCEVFVLELIEAFIFGHSLQNRTNQREPRAWRRRNLNGLGFDSLAVQLLFLFIEFARVFVRSGCRSSPAPNFPGGTDDGHSHPGFAFRLTTDGQEAG